MQLFADNSITYQTYQVGSSVIKISADKDLNNLVLPSDRTLGGLDVDLVIESDNAPISNISIGETSFNPSSNRVEYSHKFTGTDSSKSILSVTLSDGSSANIGFFVRPAMLISNEITIETDPTGIKILAAGNYYTVKGSGKTFKVRVSNITKERRMN